MDNLKVVKLPRVMEVTRGRRDVIVCLIDRPVTKDHPGLAGARLCKLSDALYRTCMLPQRVACSHATFVVGMLFGRGQSEALSICPDSTLLTRLNLQRPFGPSGRNAECGTQRAGSRLELTRFRRQRWGRRERGEPQCHEPIHHTLRNTGGALSSWCMSLRPQQCDSQVGQASRAR